MSIGAHLAERNYALRFLDAAGEPAFQHSPSAPEPEAEEYIGTAGLQSVAESLAAIQLTGPTTPPGPEGGRASRSPGRHPSGAEAGPQPFDDRLMDKLAAHRLRGPVLAILGNLTPAEARALAPAAGFAANAFALVITERPRNSTMCSKHSGSAAGGPSQSPPRRRCPQRGRPSTRTAPRRWQPPPTCGAERGSGHDTDTAAQRGPALRPSGASRERGPPSRRRVPSRRRGRRRRRSAHSRGSWPWRWQSPSPVPR